MVEAVKRRLLRCPNVTSLHLSWDSPYCYDSHHVPVMSELLQMAPRVVQISSDTVSNWMVTTAVGTKLYNQYTPSEALSTNDVLEIVLRCLVSRDAQTLSLFCAIVPSDLQITHGSIFISSNQSVDDITVKGCYHFTNCGSREVQLQLKNNFWVVSVLGEKVDF